MEIQTGNAPTDRYWLLILAGLYLAVGIPLAAGCVEQLCPDGVSYLLLAEHWARGEWGTAVVGHWSPLLPWLISLLLRVGLSPLVAARAILLLSGLGLSFGTWCVLGRLGLSWPFRWAATFAFAIMALERSTNILTPDILVAAVVSVYFWQSLDGSLVHRSSTAFKCGLVAGVAYLAKAYAFPFFLLHFSVLTVIYSRRAGPGITRRALRTFALGLAGAAIFVLPWATAISVKYGYPTITTAPAVRTEITPEGEKRLPQLCRLYHPQEGRLNTWEDPFDGTVSYPTWNPIAGGDSFKHHLQKIDSNLTEFRRFVGYAAHWDILSGLLFCALLVVIAGRAPGPATTSLQWILWTVAAYASGYIVFHALPRYFLPVEPILLGLAFLLLQMLATNRDQHDISGGRRPLFHRRAYLAVAILAAVFTINPVAHISSRFTHPPEAAAARAAEQLRSLSLHSPLAASKWDSGLYVSYHLRMKYLGRPASESPAEIAQELHDAGAGTFLVWEDAALAEALDRQPGMRRVGTITIPSKTGPGKVVVFNVEAGKEQ